MSGVGGCKDWPAEGTESFPMGHGENGPVKGPRRPVGTFWGLGMGWKGWGIEKPRLAGLWGIWLEGGSSRRDPVSAKNPLANLLHE